MSQYECQQNQELLYDAAALNILLLCQKLIYLILNETKVILIVLPLFTKCNCNLNTLFYDITVTDYSY